MRILRRLVAVAAVLYLAAVAYRVYSRKYYIWLPGYAEWTVRAGEAPAGPVHVLFYYVDHFEPGARMDLMERWEREYPAFAARHRDRGGRVLQHGWFYPGDQPIARNLAVLRALAMRGYGEIELHYHHGRDTQESTRRKFAAAIAFFQEFGFLKGTDGRTHFAFIHGNWGLDNSRGFEFCGANRELELLRQLGCFADYTFPSLWQDSQPRWVNGIYEATDGDGPKSYERAVPVRAGVQPVGDLMIFQGPLVMYLALDPARLFFRVEDGDIHPAVPATPRRVDEWMRANVHIEGRPEWVFIKVHTHGASSDADASEAMGAHMDQALGYLERHYNDGAHYVLHYVTAREAYNVARAAIDGRTGDPGQYLNYAIPPYAVSTGAR